MLRRILKAVWWTLAGVIVTLAVALSAARLLLPEMSGYRAQIETLAGDYLQREVEIGSLDAAWHGLSPVLKLERVVLRGSGPDGRALQIGEVQVALDIVESLLQRRWLTSGIRLIGLDLAIETDLVNRPGTLDWMKSLRWLVRQRSISLEDVQLRWEDAGLFETPVQLQGVALQLVNEGTRHQFLLETALPASLGESLKLAADFRGLGSNPARWRGKVYVKTADLAVATFSRAFPELPVAARGRLDLELWSSVRAGVFEWGRGAMALRQASFTNRTPDAQSYDASAIRSVFHWRQRQPGWQLELKQFAIERGGREVWPASDFSMRLQTAPSTRVRGRVSLLVVEEIDAMLPLLPWVDTDALAMVDRLEPTGRLDNAEFRLQVDAGATPQFALRADFSDLGIEASAGLPGLSGLSGRIEGNLQSGTLQIDSRQGSLTLPKALPAPLAIDSMAGTVSWQRFDRMFRIDTRRLDLRSGPLALSARLRLDWPYEQPVPWMDLQLALEDISLPEIVAYLPTRLMRPRAVAWLQRALVSGTASNGRFLLQGRLDQIPFDDHQGRLEARFDFEDAVLAYHPAWGTLEELDGHALFEGRSMRITATSAIIQEAHVERAVATIDNLKKPLLDVNGTVDGTLASMLAYVDGSPLGRRFGKLVSEIEAVGEAGLRLDMSVPLVRGLGTLRIDGEVDFDGNELVPKTSGVGLTDIRGTLHFSRKGFSAKRLDARLFGRPVRAAVYPRGRGERARTVIDIAGNLRYSDFDSSGKSLLSSRVDGTARWQILLEIARQQKKAGDPSVEMVVRSDLKGIEVRLPEPVGKAADEERRLEIRWFAGQQARQPVHVRYGDDIRARLLLRAGPKPVLRKAGIRIGRGVARLPAEDVLLLEGRLAELDLGRWLEVFARPGGAGGSVVPLVTDLAIDDFYLAGIRVGDIHIRSGVREPWRFTVTGEGGEGWLQWSFARAGKPASLLARFGRLQLESRDRSAAVTAPRLKPSALPLLDVRVDDFRWGDRQLGSIVVVARQGKRGVVFETLDMTSKAVVLKGRGAWLVDGGRQRSRFEADIQGGELGELARLFGDKGSIKGGKLRGGIELDWPGSPADFSLRHIEGDLKLRVKEGRLVNVGGSGAGRLLSLVNLDSLARRLSLDFSDVFKEGFTFDRMEGHFVIMDGDAFTNDFRIKGSSANIEMIGRTGLVDHDYDQLVTVTPKISSTLPLAGVIAGGPVVGAAAYLADKLVGDALNRMSRVQYQVTGSWEHPVYTRLPRPRVDGGVVDNEDEP